MKITIKTYGSTTEPTIGDKALLPLYDGWAIVELHSPEIIDTHRRVPFQQDKIEPCKKQTDIWNFKSRFGTSSQPFYKYMRPFDENGNLLPIEMWDKVIEELGKDRIILLD